MKKKKTATQSPQQKVDAVRAYAAQHGVGIGESLKALKIPVGTYYNAIARIKRAKKAGRAQVRAAKKTRHPNARAFESMMTQPLVTSAPTRQGKKVTAMIVSGDPAEVAATLAKMMEGNG